MNLLFTKENIIIAFWEIYREKSINKITIKELMDKAGYHRSVFYTYFKNIYDLLEQEQEDFFIQNILNCFFLNQEDKYTLKYI
ncbi:MULTISPECIES: TetR/AcrR family transcriptional regulator [Megamonas]|uniref:TetR/AcrR family transcriptional regulator n=1 Tax=Megamonas TaxID=158846 RepID=UPI00216B375E|nr:MULTISPECIES: TetR/AcrR family transcriptional regulator [Megamonas]